MKNSQKLAITLLSAATALLAACGGSYEDGFGEDDSDDSVADDVELGTAYQHMYFPYCASTASDPEKDGWGFEKGMFCLVSPSMAAAAGYASCKSSASDPDGDGWGYEGYKACVVVKNASSSSTGSGTGASCANLDGTASTMAALVVASGLELKRWQPTKDFMVARVGNQDMLQLTATGKARCADGKCLNTQALLDFQKSEANGQIKFPNNVTLNSDALRSRLVAKFGEQKSCEAQPSNGGNNCPVEEHTLTFQKAEKGGCDTNYYFVAKAPNGAALKYPSQLKNKLLWADHTNPYVQFKNVGDTVSVDPTYGLNEFGSTSTGACTAACVKISASNAAGSCCTCGGANRSFRKSPWTSATFLCL